MRRRVFAATVVVGLIVAMPGGAAAPSSAHAFGAMATLVRTLDTGAASFGNAPSPDPSGLAYIPMFDRLIVVDGDVEETTGAGWHNTNGWFARRSDGLAGTGFNTLTASPANKEPVGAAYDPARNELYIARDGANSTIYVYNPITMLQVRSFSVTGAPYNDADAEGLGFGNGILYMTDAIDNDMVKVEPGPDGVVGTGNDDVVSNYDLQQYGLDEPEGLDVHPESGNIWVVSNRVTAAGPQPLIEVTPNGALVSSVSIAAANPVSPSGLAIVPTHGGDTYYNIYITDRGVENGADPTENDGRIYELQLGGGEPTPVPHERLTNVSFELPGFGAQPANWTAHPSFTRTSDVVHSGTYAARHASTENIGYQVFTETSAVAGTNYAFSGWINVPPTTDTKFAFELQIKWRARSGNVGTTIVHAQKTATSGWTLISGTVTAPPGATTMRIIMKLKSLNAVVYVDDFSLVG